MGTTESTLTAGYRVLNVQNGSPCDKGGLVSYFDFIMKANDIRLDEENDAFVQLIKQYEDKALKLVLYNTKKQCFREVTIKPSKGWGGHGLLGITIKYDSYENSEDVLRVLDVEADSPAAEAKLVSDLDFILGTANDTFCDSGALSEVVLDHLGQQLNLYVYNTDTDCVRLVALKPRRGWGGDGCLGLDVGSGYLHTLPVKCRDTVGKNYNDPNAGANPFLTVAQPTTAAPAAQQPAPAASTPDIAPVPAPAPAPTPAPAPAPALPAPATGAPNGIQSLQQRLAEASARASTAEQEYLRFFVDEMDMDRESGVAKIEKAKTDPAAKGKLKPVYNAHCAVRSAREALRKAQQESSTVVPGK